MSGILAKAVGGIIARRAVKSVTSWLGTAVAVTGGAAVIEPEVLEAIPEPVRGWAVLAVGVAVVLARHRKEITALYADLKALRPRAG